MKGIQDRGIWVARLFAAIAGVAAFIGVMSYVFDRVSLVRDRQTYFMVSGRPVRDDQALKSICDSSQRVVYLRRESGFAQSLLKEANATEAQLGESLVLIAEDKKSDRVALSGNASVAEAVRVASTEASAGTVPWILFGALAGCLIGVFTKPSRSLFVGAFLFAAAAAMWKLATACPTCPTTLILGIDAAIVGIVFYSVLVALSVLGIGPAVFIGMGVASSLALAWQVTQYLATGMNCPPCSGIAFVNALCAVTIASSKVASIQAEAERRVLRNTWARVALGVLSIGILAAPTFIHATSEKGKSALTQVLHTPDLVGNSISQIGISMKNEDRPQVLLLWLSTCEPCHKAIRVLAAEADLPLRSIQLTHSAETPAKGTEHLPFQNGLIRGTPAILVVDRKGIVKSEFYGWADDPEWSKSFVAQLKQNLHEAQTIASANKRKTEGGNP